MGQPKPFHRIYRRVRTGRNAGFSSWNYIIDRDYAKNCEHYTRAYFIIQKDLEKIFEYVEPSDESFNTYSYRIHELLMRTCIEVEANFKAILEDNIFRNDNGRILNMSHYVRIEKSHNLSDYEVSLPIWRGGPRTFKPFSNWKTYTGEEGAKKWSPDWYSAYNYSKHNRQKDFNQANLGNLLNAVAGLLVVISSQFVTEDFSAAPTTMSINGSKYEYHSMGPAIGSLFRISFPDNWDEHDVYDFDWNQLRDRPDRFQKYDYGLVK